MNALDIFSNYMPFILEGQVVRTDDPDQMGRVKIWIPSLDGENFEIESLPWCEYAPPSFGYTVDYPAGGEGNPNFSHTSYGMWTIPKMGSTVFVFCVAGNPMRRAYFAASVRLHRNRALPAGRNKDGFDQTGPWGDAGDGAGKFVQIEPAYSNLRQQFQNKLTEAESLTRGVYERQVAQASNAKDGTEGYSKTPAENESYLDSQTTCWVTPGRHAIIFQDDPKFARCRIKTADGHQIILDDANERIYISTAKGKSWIELDSDGHVHIFASESMSIRSGADINMFADRDINLEANRQINLKANGGDIRVSAKDSIHLNSGGDSFWTSCADLNLISESTFKMTAQNNLDIGSLAGDIAVTSARGLDLKAGEKMKLGASRIDLNGPIPRSAAVADCASQSASPTVVPGHEPWVRPESKSKRGKNWKK